jgi:hypothetical protein
VLGKPLLDGRYTAELAEDGVVVFLIGMRFNQWWRIDKWWFVAAGMISMLRYLAGADDGLLKSHYWVGRTLLYVQYWRSLDELMAFATDSRAPHAKTWREFNRRVGDDGTVGIFHETYQIVPGNSEAMYVNMPAFGLGAALEPVAVGKSRNRARQRMANQLPGRRPKPAKSA